MGTTRVVHRVRCRKKDDNQIWADVKVVDALSVIQPNGSSRLIWTRAKDANPCIVDKTGGGNAKGTPGNCTRLSHMELVTGQEDSSQQIYIEVLDAIAFTPPKKGDPDGAGPQDNIEQTGGLPKAAVFGRGPYALFLPENSASKYVVDKVGLGLAQGSSESASRTEHVCLVTEDGNTDDKTDKADAIPPQVLAWCATLKIDAINFKVPGGNITLMIGKGLQDEKDTTQETTDPATGEPCPPDNTDPNVYVAFPPDTTGCDVKIPTRSGNVGPLDMGPLWWIDRISGGLPVYVSIYCSAARLGANEPHSATVTLSEAAIAKGCSIVLNTESTIGDPYYVYLRLAVIKCPGPIPDVLCTLVTRGTRQTTDLPAPEGFCGTYSSESTTTDMGTYVVPGLPPFTFPLGIPNVTMHRFHIHTAVTDPDGTTGTDYNLDIIDSFLDAYKLANPNFHVGTDTFSAQYWSYYDEDGHLHNLLIPCVDPPTTQTDDYPFDIEVVVNPQKDHTVSVPADVSFLLDPSAVVKTDGSGDFGGQKTSIWRSFLDYRLTQHSLNGVMNATIDFKIQKNLFAVQRKEKIIEVFPSTTIFGFTNLGYSGSFRLNKGTPSPFIYNDNWAGTPPDFNDGINLYAGAPPPPVTWTPYNIPF